MDALQALLERVSVPRLTEPAPQGEIRQKIFAAALRAPDHGQLRPWQFLVVEGQARDELGEVFVQCMQEAAEGAMTEEQLQKVRELPMRAPLLIVVVAKITEGKTPANESRRFFPPRADVDFVNAHRRAKHVAVAALLQPRVVVPLELRRVPDDGSVLRRGFEKETVGVSL